MAACPHLIEEPLGEWPEALGTHEAVLMVQLPAAVDDALGGAKAGLAALAHSIGQGIRHIAEGQRGGARLGLGAHMGEVHGQRHTGLQRFPSPLRPAGASQVLSGTQPRPSHLAPA